MKVGAEPMWNRNHPLVALLHCSVESSIVGTYRGETDGIACVENSGRFILQEGKGRTEAGMRG
jgi:hypothetical protein